jgi:amino acid transporter
VGAATVANGWSGYFQKGVLLKFGIAVPFAFSGAPYKYDEGHVLPNAVAVYQSAEVTQEFMKGDDGGEAGVFWVLTKDHETLGKAGSRVGLVGDSEVESQIQSYQQAMFNLPAILVVVVITFVLVKGISESAGFNALMVFIKVAAVLFVILVGAFYINPDNWTPFAPYGWAGETNAKGEPVGMIAGAAIIFFAYIGFDSVSTHAEEAVNPQRDVPIGIIASLLVCTVLYVAVVAVLTGMVPYHELSKDAGVSDAFKSVGLPWAEGLIAAAGVAGITSVLLVMMLSAPRVFLAMARDGLVPKSFFADVPMFIPKSARLGRARLPSGSLFRSLPACFRLMRSCT